jgi:hypothetical protein
MMSRIDHLYFFFKARDIEIGSERFTMIFCRREDLFTVLRTKIMFHQSRKLFIQEMPAVPGIPKTNYMIHHIHNIGEIIDDNTLTGMNQIKFLQGEVI